MKISRRGVDTGTDGSAAEVYCIHFSAHVSEAQDVSFDHGSVSVEGLAETHGNGILQLCTTHFDHIDKKIIGMLQENARTPIKEIAKEVYLSSPAVSARTSRLEKEGILKGFHAEVNYEAFGYGIKAFINLSVEPYQKKEFYPFIQSVPNVIECNCVTGDYSMLIEVAYQSTVELDHFINVLQRFGHTKTLIVFSTSVEHRDIVF